MNIVTTNEERQNVHLHKLCQVDEQTGLLKNLLSKGKIRLNFFRNTSFRRYVCLLYLQIVFVAHLFLMVTKRSAPRVPFF